MRQTAARLNRAWLTVLGLLLLLSGLAVLVVGTGLLRPIATAVGVSRNRPGPTDRLFGSATSHALTLPWVALLLALAGLVVALLAVLWLLAQIPRSNSAKPFRLHDSVTAGLTRCAPSVLTDAVEAQVKGLPDVQNAAAVLRGTASRPDLTVKVTVSDRADVPRLLHTIATRVAEDLGEALDTQLSRLSVQVEIGTTRSSSHQITVFGPHPGG
jgi:hypothetical protein